MIMIATFCGTRPRAPWPPARLRALLLGAALAAATVSRSSAACAPVQTASAAQPSKADNQDRRRGLVENVAIMIMPAIYTI